MKTGRAGFALYLVLGFTLSPSLGRLSLGLGLVFGPRFVLSLNGEPMKMIFRIRTEPSGCWFNDDPRNCVLDEWPPSFSTCFFIQDHFRWSGHSE